MGMFVASYPFVGGYDGAGIVEEVGEGVTNFVKGDRVSVICYLTSNHDAHDTMRISLYMADSTTLDMHTFQDYGISDASFTAKVSRFLYHVCMHSNLTPPVVTGPL